MNRYFLDESGHGGDLASSTKLDFSGQPIFALACLGVADEGALACKLEQLRTTYGCGSGELKSSDLSTKLPAVAVNLATWLVENGADLFIELVEKRYFIAIHIVNRLLCGPYGLHDVDQLTRIQLVETLADRTFDPVLRGYLEACRSQSLGDVAATLQLLQEVLARSRDGISPIGRFLARFASQRVQNGNATTHDFLPIADESSTGKKVWMLPNLQSLTNIYARINQSRRHLDGVALIHDVQLQYGKVLHDAKASMEAPTQQIDVPFTPFADYRLRGRAVLTFAEATAEPCLQAADIMAGCAMRFGRSASLRPNKGTALRDAFLAMLAAGNPLRGTGINFVASDRTLRRLQVPYAAAAPFVR
ncbi:DUF3800 domain-containing protein [Sphingomonas sp. R86521]|uniref:DUF3800 domain-containing protein n=1 Tax=Sphingomonas sp. R86521 TaxID=3093860 RepID=UPI0036D32CBD